MNVNHHDDNTNNKQKVLKFADEQPTRIDTLQTAIRRATQLMDGEIMELVKKEHRSSHRLTVDELYTNAKSPAIKRKRRIEGLKRHAAGKFPPLSTDLRYRTVHPNASNFELDVLNIMDNHPNKKPKQSDIYKELSKQERMIQNQGKNVLTKRYQLCQSSLGELLRNSAKSTGGQSDSPSRIVLSSP